MSVEFKDIVTKSNVVVFPDVVSVVVSYPGVLNIPSYLDLSLFDNILLANKIYDTWCSNVSDVIIPTVNYQSHLISSLNVDFASELKALNVLYIDASHINYINYILNKDKYYTETLGFAFGDVQTALWTLLFDTLTTHSSTPFNISNVIGIIVDALTNGKNYVPKLSIDYYGIFVVPVGITPNVGNTIIGQALIMQVTLADTTIDNITRVGYSKCGC